MKKTIPFLLTTAMLFSLVACGSTGANNSNSAQSTPESSTSTEPTSTSEGSSTLGETPTPEETPDSETGKTLIAYFSWSGNTEKLAGMIQDETGGDLFAIETEALYTDDYNAVVDQAKQEQADNIRPALAAQVENMDDYDTVFIGYPNWWSDVPMAVLTFVENYDWTGKTVIPFCTSGGGGFGNGIDSIETGTEGATVLEGFHVSGSSVDGAQSDVADWIAGLGLDR